MPNYVYHATYYGNRTKRGQSNFHFCNLVSSCFYIIKMLPDHVFSLRRQPALNSLWEYVVHEADEYSLHLTLINSFCCCFNMTSNVVTSEDQSLNKLNILFTNLKVIFTNYNYGMLHVKLLLICEYYCKRDICLYQCHVTLF